MATRKVYASYQEIIDLSTEGGANGNPAVTAIGIHTPTGYTPHKMFPGFFQQYKKWKYLGCSLVMVPAATLPVDPLAVGYEAGESEQYIDMRDVLNPIMFHGCHGDDLGTILNTLYAKDTAGNKLSDSANFWIEDGTTTHADLTELLEGVYYKALTDMTWKKADPQRGFKKSGFRPLLYSMATNQPILPSASGNGVIVDANGDVVNDGGVYDLDGSSLSPQNVRQFFTPHLVRLGWMDTRLPYGTKVSEDSLLGDDGEYDDVRAILQGLQNYATLPKLFMGVLLLPPAYRVKQWFRLVLTHRFAFAGFRPASMTQNILGAPGYFRDLDYSTGGESNDDLILGGSDDPVPPEPDPPTPSGVTVKFTNSAGSDTTFTAFLSTSDVPTNSDAIVGSTTASNMPAEFENIADGTYYAFIAVSSSKDIYAATLNGSSGTEISGSGINYVKWTVTVSGSNVNCAFYVQLD